MVAEGQFEYNGLVFGRDTAFHVRESIEGLSVAMPDVRLNETDNPEAHGAFVDGEFVGARHVLIPGVLLVHLLSSQGDMQAQIDDFRRAFAPQRSDLPLDFWEPTATAARRFLCKPVRRSSPSERVYMTRQAARWAVEMVGGDPRIYSAAQKSLVIQPGASPTGGVTFPVTFPLNFGGGTSIQGTANNAGSVAALPTARIDGPCTNPILQNDNAEGGTIKRIQMGIVLSGTEWLDIDFAAQTILLNGTASRYNTLTIASEWWAVEPGNNTIQFIVSGATAATKLTLSWRDAWM